MKRGFSDFGQICTVAKYISQWFDPMHYVLDQRKLEGVQQCATKLVSSLVRDRSTNLPSLLYRRHRRDDLIFLFKLLKWSLQSRSLQLYLYKPEVTHTNYAAHHSCQVNYFGTVINDWNNLTSNIVENS